MALIECAECGRQLSDQASSCPNCGHPIARAEEALDSAATKPCPKCAERVKEGATVCKHCGYDFVRGQRGGCGPALLSLLIPGLGQLVKGQVLSGVIYFIVAVALWFALLGWVVSIVSAVAAYKRE